jgi:hypothetical protein
MRASDTVDPVQNPPIYDVEYQHRFEVFGRNKEPVSLKVDFEMIEVARHIIRQSKCMRQLKWGRWSRLRECNGRRTECRNCP